ncbi:MAG: hypothetical protein JNL96_25950 [Planctomycetaceae bacterium]|nr:hypothetical protein [Planctomycetaceae bacterium]
MTQVELERELARSTGESLCTIRNRGFSLMVMPDRCPLTVDWDQVQECDRLRYSPRRRPLRRRLAA